MMEGNIPVLSVSADNLPLAWERSVVKTRKKGIRVTSEHERKGDPPSWDSTMVITVHTPLAEPRIHRCFVGSDPGDLEVYRQVIINGIHDHNVKVDGWSYSYHDRQCNYPPGIDQIGYIVEKLAETLYTRRAQAITWVPEIDTKSDEPPCLQRVWCRAIRDRENRPVLNLNTHWRSRNAFKAGFMNMWAYIELQKYIASLLEGRVGKPVVLGRYTDISDSYHIEGKDEKEVEDFLRLIEKRSFEERTWTTAFVEPFFEKARKKIEAEQKRREKEIKLQL